MNKYEIVIPLDYNKNSLKELNNSVELTCSYVLTRPIIICNGSKTDSINENNYKSQEEDSVFDCKFTEIEAQDETEAISIITPTVINICKELTFYLNLQNDNKQIFQPNVIPLWQKLSVKNTSGNPEKLAISDKVKTFSHKKIDVKNFDMAYWIDNKNLTYSFLLTEYYMAFGEENIKSKFFHLFTILEFCEKEFENENKAVKLLNADLISKIEDNVKDLVLGDNDNKNNMKIISRLKQTLSELTDINRTEKLLNILDYMEIHSIKIFSNEINIDKDLINNLIKLRNKSYHGDKNNSVDSEFVTYVLKLMLICEQIISFLKKDLSKSNQNN